MSGRALLAPGPFRAEDICPGSPYELSNGHRILAMGTGTRGSIANLVGGGVLETDPAVKTAGVDMGFSNNPHQLRAPDIAVGDFANEPGWAPGAPPLAVEYADTGQDYAELKKKIAELFDGGTRYVWVVRLTGPRRVEIHEKGRKMRLALPGHELTAPGILKNPVPVAAMYDRTAAHQATFRNLLQRQGYESLDAVREEGELKGELEGCRNSLFTVLKARGITVSAAEHAQILAADDLDLLERWLIAATTARTTAQVLAAPRAPRAPRAAKRKRRTP